MSDDFIKEFGLEPKKSNLFEHIQHLREINSLEDHVRIKEKIKELLSLNPYLLKALNTDSDNFSVCHGRYILPYYLIIPTQEDTKNYLCYETSFNEVSRFNDIFKYNQITFNILCKAVSMDDKNNDFNIIDFETGIARHDLIAILLIEQFNCSNAFGHQIHLVSDTSRPIDNAYCARTLVFEQITPNSIIKNGKVMNNAKHI